MILVKIGQLRFVICEKIPSKSLDLWGILLYDRLRDDRIQITISNNLSNSDSDAAIGLNEVL